MASKHNQSLWCFLINKLVWTAQFSETCKHDQERKQEHASNVYWKKIQKQWKHKSAAIKKKRKKELGKRMLSLFWRIMPKTGKKREASDDSWSKTKGNAWHWQSNVCLVSGCLYKGTFWYSTMNFRQTLTDNTCIWNTQFSSNLENFKFRLPQMPQRCASLPTFPLGLYLEESAHRAQDFWAKEFRWQALVSSMIIP